MNLPETLSQGVLIAWTGPEGKIRLRTSPASISPEKNNGTNLTRLDMACSFCVYLPQGGM
jgi:hypothetical protein